MNDSELGVLRLDDGTPLTDFLLVQTYRQQKSIQKTAQYLRLPYSKIRLMLKARLGDKIRGRRLFKIDDESARDFYDKGYNDFQIARVLKVSKYQVKSWRQRNHLPPVDQSGKERVITNKEEFSKLNGGAETMGEIMIVKLINNFFPAGVTAKELWEKTGLTPNYVYLRLRKLMERGVIVKAGRCYTLPERQNGSEG